jgi:hypothetical protein
MFDAARLCQRTPQFRRLTKGGLSTYVTGCRSPGGFPRGCTVPRLIQPQPPTTGTSFFCALETRLNDGAIARRAVLPASRPTLLRWTRLDRAGGGDETARFLRCVCGRGGNMAARCTRAAIREDPSHRVPLAWPKAAARRGVPTEIARAGICRGKEHHR